MRPTLLAVLLLLAAPAFARSPVRQPAPPPVPSASDSPFAECEAAISVAEAPARVPDRIVPSIARVESGRLDPATGRIRPWPWTINVEGTGTYFETKADAIAAVRALQARGVRSIDVGCMQVNLMHHPRAFAALEDAFDPAANARYAVSFLSVLYRQTHNWGLATAMYHSATPERGEDYQRRVFGRVVTPMGISAAGTGPGRWPLPVTQFAAIPPASITFAAFAPPQTAFSYSPYGNQQPAGGFRLPPPAATFGIVPSGRPGRR